MTNGNASIMEGTDGRLIEVTRDHEIVWDYISPYYGKNGNHNMIYRAYRLPFEWIPQINAPEEVPVPRLDNSKFRVGGIGDDSINEVTELKRGGRVNPDPRLCVVSPSVNI